jgi:accessory gene regulator B
MGVIAIIEKWATNGAKYIAAHSTRSVHPDVLRFGLHLLIEMVIKLFVWLVLGLILQDWTAWFLIFFGFIVTRMIVGGVHASSFLKCLLWSSSVLLCAYGMSTAFLYGSSIFDWMQLCIVLLLLLLFFGIWRRGIPLQIGDRTKTKKRMIWTKVIAWVWIIILTLFLIVLDFAMYPVLSGAIISFVFSLKPFQRLINADI